MNLCKAKQSRIWKVLAACGIAVSLAALLLIAPSSAQTQSSQTLGGPAEVSAQDAPLVTVTTRLATPVPFQPWNAAFIEAQTKRQQSGAIPRGASAGTATGPAVPSEVTNNLISTPQSATHVSSDHSDTYSLTVNGSLDPLNSSIRIENVGDTAVVNPKLIVNGKDWSTLDRILAQIVSPGMSDEEKARAIWEFARINRYHYWPPSVLSREDADPVKLFNIYGYGFCTDISLAMTVLFDAAGMTSRFWHIGVPGQHDVSEVWYGGAWHMLEADRDGLYLELDNKTIAGVEDLIANPNLVARAGATHADLVPWYAQTPTFQNWPAAGHYEVGHEISMTLRPNEALVLNWQNNGLFHNDSLFDYPPPYIYGNGQIISPLDLTNPNYDQWITSASNIRAQVDDGQSPAISPLTTSVPADLVYQVDSPYPLVGITLTANLHRQSTNDTLDIYTSRYPSLIEILGPDIAQDKYQIPGLFVGSSNLLSMADDGQWPPLHPAVTNQPSYLIYHLEPLDLPRVRVQVGGQFYRFRDTDVVSMSLSSDGVKWQEIWHGTSLDLFDHMEDITDRVAGLSSFFIRYEMLAGSVASVNITTGIGEIKLHGVIPPADVLAWSAANAVAVGDFVTTIDLTPFVAAAKSSALYHYRVKFVMRSDEAPLNVGLNGLTLTSMVQIAPWALPALKLGANQVRYTDQSSEATNVAVTQQWIEQDGWHVPLAPTTPVFPANGVVISTTQPVTFSWQSGTDPDGEQLWQYHFELCDRPDCAWPLSSIFDTDLSNFDAVLQQPIQNKSTAWLMPYVDWLNPGQTYYWRVKVQDSRWLWSEYSPIWSFTVADVINGGLNPILWLPMVRR